MFNNNSTPFNMPVMPAYGGYGGGGGFGWGSDWIALLAIAMIFGWGGFGYGGFGGGGFGGFPFVVNNGGCQCAKPEDITAGFNNQAVINKLNGLENGLCSLGYDQLAQMQGINNNITATGGNIRDAVQQDTIANMQNQFGLIQAINGNAVASANQARDLQAQLTQCCCDNEKTALMSRFDAQTYNCNTLSAIDKLGDRIEALIVGGRMADKDAKIAELTGALDRQQLKADIINGIIPPARPAYITCSPFQSAWGNGFGYGSQFA